MLRVGPRCSASGCANFANSSRADGRCNSCAAGKAPAREDRVVEVAAASVGSDVVSAPADNEATIEAKLARSMETARSYADDPAAAAALASGRVYAPFALQRKVCESEQIFHVRGGVYIGSEYAAADLGLLKGLGITRVINITSGARTVPNFGESLPDWRYVHFALQDRLGFPVRDVLHALTESARLLDEWDGEGRKALVHCSAGLCRSASAVMAWLMTGKRAGAAAATTSAAPDSAAAAAAAGEVAGSAADVAGPHGMNLAQAVATLTAARGRPPACSPSYWSALVTLERAAFPVPVAHAAAAAPAAADGGAAAGAGAAPSAGALPPPSFDFTEWVTDELSSEAGSTSLQLAPAADVARLLRENNWDAAAVVDALLG